MTKSTGETSLGFLSSTELKNKELRELKRNE